MYTTDIKESTQAKESEIEERSTRSRRLAK
jgi:hypothetical protein